MSAGWWCHLRCWTDAVLVRRRLAAGVSEGLQQSDAEGCEAFRHSVRLVHDGLQQFRCVGLISQTPTRGAFARVAICMRHRPSRLREGVRLGLHIVVWKSMRRRSVPEVLAASQRARLSRDEIEAPDRRLGDGPGERPVVFRWVLKDVMSVEALGYPWASVVCSMHRGQMTRGSWRSRQKN